MDTNIPHEGRVTWLMSACVLALTLMLAGCGRMVFAWQGPDPVFAAFDIDRDDAVSREEWERAYGTSALDDAVLEFDQGDCDRDGRLTWDEYFLVRFREEHCQTAPLQLLRMQAGSSAAAADVTSIHHAKEFYLARVSLLRTRQKLVAGKFHEGYSERDMQPGTLHFYRLACGGLEQVEIPAMSRDFHEISRLGQQEPGFHPAIRCTVSNLSDHTVSYLRLRLVVRTPAREAATFHGKTLWIPPRDSRDFWVLTGSAQAVAIDLLAVRLTVD